MLTIACGFGSPGSPSALWYPKASHATSRSVHEGLRVKIKSYEFTMSLRPFAVLHIGGAKFNARQGGCQDRSQMACSLTSACSSSCGLAGTSGNVKCTRRNCVLARGRFVPFSSMRRWTLHEQLAPPQGRCPNTRTAPRTLCWLCLHRRRALREFLCVTSAAEEKVRPATNRTSRAMKNCGHYRSILALAILSSSSDSPNESQAGGRLQPAPYSLLDSFDVLMKSLR